MIQESMFIYNDLSATNLLESLACPSNLTFAQTYEDKRDLVTGMRIYRGAGTDVVLRNYTYDALGRPLTRTTSRNGTTQNDTFGYNPRSELTSATLGNANYAYAFDNIGNRETSSEAGTALDYTANNLNQYTSIAQSSSSSQEEGDRAEGVVEALTYDTDGNATLIQTSTGTWAISYNGANRPVRFRNEETDTTVDCGYDSQGRRYFKKVTVEGTVTLHHRYIYRGYLQIACVDCTRSGHPALWFVTWDPSQATATRPLAIQKDGTWFTYGYDITKNVCEVFGPAGYIRTAYSYAPFGNVSASGDVSQPFQWSSEHYDSELDLVYYNFRHYSPALGRFLSRDPIAEQGGLNLYAFVKNNPIQKWDKLGRAIPQLGAGPDAESPMPPPPDCEKMINNFMSWYAQEKAKLDERDENGKNWIEKLPKCPNALRKVMKQFRTTLPSGCTYYEERLTFMSPDLSEWTLTSDIVFEVTQILGLLSCGMRYHPSGSYELRTRDTSKYDGHGNQCIYDNEGNLIREIPTAGTVDWVGPGGSKIEHRNADVLQFENAVRIDSSCGGNGKYVRMYYEVRPSW